MGELWHTLNFVQSLTLDRQLQHSLHRSILRMRLPSVECYQQSTFARTISTDTPTMIRNRFKKVHLGTKMYELHLSFGIIRIRMAKESVIDGSSQQSHTTLVKRATHWRVVATFLPKVTSWKILECTFNRKYNSIDAGIQTFNIRPEWSPIFKRASRGDMQGVRNLIADGLASPNDVDPEGWTVLHVSHIFGFHICGLLNPVGILVRGSCAPSRCLPYASCSRRGTRSCD